MLLNKDRRAQKKIFGSNRLPYAMNYSGVEGVITSSDREHRDIMRRIQQSKTNVEMITVREEIKKKLFAGKQKDISKIHGCLK